jgi:hypothetical protein
MMQSLQNHPVESCIPVFSSSQQLPKQLKNHIKIISIPSNPATFIFPTIKTASPPQPLIPDITSLNKQTFRFAVLRKNRLFSFFLSNVSKVLDSSRESYNFAAISKKSSKRGL